MGNAFCFGGTRRTNRVLPTNSAVLALGVGNKDLASYRRHRKKDDVELGPPVVPGISKDGKEISKGESSKQESSENSKECKSDKEMQDWLASIILQNHLLPGYVTFDRKRHLSMRSKYADTARLMNFCNVIHETKEEHLHRTKYVAPSRSLEGLKKAEKQRVRKSFSHETFNLGLGPAPKLSTRISKDAVKRNRQKDNQLKFHGGKSPPPPKWKSLVAGPSGSKASILRNSKSKEASGTLKTSNLNGIQKAEKHFSVSSNWLDEDFEESILSYPKEIRANIQQCSKLPPIPTEGNYGKKSIKFKTFKIEPETSEPAIHNLGLFLTAVEEDQSVPPPRGWFWDGLRRINRASVTYSAEDLPLQ